MFFHKQELQYKVKPDGPTLVTPASCRPLAYQYQNFSDGQLASTGSWASGLSPDGNGQFTDHDGPTTSAPMPGPTQPDPRLYGTSDKPNLMEKVMARVKDVTNN